MKSQYVLPSLNSMIFDQIYGKRIGLPRYFIFNFWILSELNVDLEILYSYISICEHIYVLDIFHFFARQLFSRMIQIALSSLKTLLTFLDILSCIMRDRTKVDVTRMRICWHNQYHNDVSLISKLLHDDYYQLFNDDDHVFQRLRRWIDNFKSQRVPELDA